MRTQAILKTIAIFAFPATFLFTACDPTAIKGEGDILTETRDVKDFTGVDISVEGEVHILQGQAFKVEVKAEESILPYLETVVENGSLHVYFSHNVRNVDGLEVEITMPQLKTVQVSGSADVHTHGTFAGGTLNVGLSGSSNTTLSDLDYQYIATNVSGSGHVLLNGKALELDANVSGSGGVDALQCPVKNAEVHVSGSGTVKVKVSDKLIAHVSGSGSIRYEGDPTVEKHISGSGSVVKN